MLPVQRRGLGRPSGGRRGESKVAQKEEPEEPQEPAEEPESSDEESVGGVVESDEVEEDLEAHLMLRSALRDKNADAMYSLYQAGIAWCRSHGIESDKKQLELLKELVPKVSAYNTLEGVIRAKGTMMWRNGVARARELASGRLVCAGLRDRAIYHLLWLAIFMCTTYLVASWAWWLTTPTRTIWTILYETWFDIGVYVMRYVLGLVQSARPYLVFLGIQSPPGVWERLGEWYSIQTFAEVQATKWFVWLSVAQISALVSWIVTWRLREGIIVCDLSKK
jgi:hypothetical protein